MPDRLLTEPQGMSVCLSPLPRTTMLPLQAGSGDRSGPHTGTRHQMDVGVETPAWWASTASDAHHHLSAHASHGPRVPLRGTAVTATLRSRDTRLLRAEHPPTPALCLCLARDKAHSGRQVQIPRTTEKQRGPALLGGDRMETESREPGDTAQQKTRGKTDTQAALHLHRCLSTRTLTTVHKCTHTHTEQR